jgi:glutamate--cysteine ligase
LLQLIENRLSRLINTQQQDLLKHGGIGLEKESLRVNSEGKIAQTPHPKVLGSALTHPYITTDYSEALIEFITPPFHEIDESLQFLKDVQKFVYEQLNDELLWATSMPCVVAGETSIPIAKYGTSNAGMMKTVYRRGLGHRYGRVMQVIAGVHFNYSVPENFWPVHQDMERDKGIRQEFISESYFAMTRNLLRFGWLVPYLFGASPTVCKSFLGGQSTSLQELSEFTYYEPYATSLRMGDIGYQNNKENETGVKANYDSLANYIKSLGSAIEAPCPEYEKIGIVVDGVYQQLNANILQIENEYYSTVRPKQLLQGNEKPVIALRERGVQYIELRSLDVNAFDPLGVNEVQLRFLEAFMQFCLLNDSPAIGSQERKEIDHNELLVAHQGRDPKISLQRKSRAVHLKEWASEILDSMQGVCELLDAGESQQLYQDALKEQMEKVEDPGKTPSARMLAEIRENDEEFFHFANRMSKQHQDYFNGQSLSEERSELFREFTDESIKRQQEIEASDTLTFEEYLQQYFSQS